MLQGQELLQDPTTLLDQFEIVRYFTISGTVILFYDTLLTSSKEVDHIWSTLRRGASNGGSPLFPKIMYLVGRYIMLVAAVTSLMLILPLSSLSEKWLAFLPMVRCQRTLFLTSVAIVFAEIVASVLVFYRLGLLWNLNLRSTYKLSMLLIVSKSMVFCFTIITDLDIQNSIRYVDSAGINTCYAIKTSPYVRGIWIPAVVSDAIAFVFLLLNALHRPRLESQRLLNLLYRDGLVLFVTLLVMRMLNLFLTAFASLPFFFLCIAFSGTIVTTVSSRTFLGLVKDELDDEEDEEIELLHQRKLSLGSRTISFSQDSLHSDPDSGQENYWSSW